MVTKILQKTLTLFSRETDKFLGKHLIAEFWGVKIKEDLSRIEKILIETAKRAGATPLEVISHKFFPHGFSAVILLSESHIALHYWPEVRYLAVDIFTCGKDSNPYQAMEYLKTIFQPKKVEIKKIYRGKLTSVKLHKF